jgi:hypothetical protein
VIPSATLTGLAYASPRGLKPMAKSGLIGLGISLAYLAVTNKELLMGQLPSVNVNTGAQKY